MPTPREFTNTVDRQGYSNARLRPADFGAAGETIGRAAQGFGQDLSRVAQNLDEIEKKDAEVAAQEADNIRLAKRMKRYYGDPDEGSLGFFNQAGKNALLDAQSLEADLRKIDEEAVALLRSKPRAQKMFEEMTLKRNTDDMPKISMHVSREREKHADAVDADAFDLALDNAANSLDPKVVDENIATAGNIAVRQAMRKGMTEPNQLAQARQSGVGKAVETVARQLNLQSPSEAQAFVSLKAGDMDPDDAAKLLETLAGPAAKERASEEVSSFIVTKGMSSYYPAADDSGEAGPTPLPANEAALDAAQWAQESGGVHRLANGELITSTAGARGVSQVMRGTGVDPGYGVKPLQNQSREEYIRFGKEYREAMLKEYDGNIVLALTAYNWGPGNLDAHLAKVGDPRKGQISDAAFLNSIPVKEAREYAPAVLGRVGISPSGASGRAAQPPIIDNEEIDLDASFARIDASDRTFRDKEALKAEVRERFSLGRQTKTARKEEIQDEVAGYLNTLKDPDSFTSYDQLPLEIRQKLSADPTMEQAYRRQATVNQQQKEARIAAENNEARTAAAAQVDLRVTTLRYQDPAAFKSTDFSDPRIFPDLSSSDRQKWMEAQRTEFGKAAGDPKFASPSAMRTAINRLAGKKPPADVGLAHDEAIQREQQWLDRNPGKSVPEVVREGIAREVMTKHTLVTSVAIGPKGELWGESRRTVRGYQVPGEVKKSGERYRRREVVDSFEAVKAQLQQVWSRVPTDDEVSAEIEKRTTARGLRL